MAMTAHVPSMTHGNSSNRPVSAAAASREMVAAASPTQKLTQRERRTGTLSEASYLTFRFPPGSAEDSRTASYGLSRYVLISACGRSPSS